MAGLSSKVGGASRSPGVAGRCQIRWLISAAGSSALREQDAPATLGDAGEGMGVVAQRVVPANVLSQKDDEEPQSDLLSKPLLIKRLIPSMAVQSFASLHLCGIFSVWVDMA